MAKKQFAVITVTIQGTVEVPLEADEVETVENLGHHAKTDHFTGRYNLDDLVNLGTEEIEVEELIEREVED